MIFRMNLLTFLAVTKLFLMACEATEQWERIPGGWNVASKPPPDTIATFTLALNMENIDFLASELLDISDTKSPNYGKYWDQADVYSRFAPSNTTVSTTLDWLVGGGVHNYTVDWIFIDFTTTIATADSLLNASYHYYTNNVTTELRTASHSVPERIQNSALLISPGTYLGVPNSMPLSLRPYGAREPLQRSVISKDDNPCLQAISPSCLKQMYKVANYTPHEGSGSTIGFSSFLNQSALYNDLFEFERHFAIPGQNISVELVAGGIDNQNESTAQFAEADLDAQTIVGIAHPLPITQFIISGKPPFIPNIDHKTENRNFNEPYVPYYRHLLSRSKSDLPYVISNSYGEQEDSVPIRYALLTCNLIGFLGLRGVTVVQSSGDTGVGSGCLAPDFGTAEFYPIFPATCPWVTSVGGTVGFSPESAWKGSSGGFSRYFSRPSYQDATVSRYMDMVASETYAYYGKYTNWNGRAFPDVAAHSLSPDFQVVYRGLVAMSGGTSASAPVWAGIVALLNDARLRAGKPVLGWLNPLLYARGFLSLNDITEGFSEGCHGINPGTNATEPDGAGIIPGARWNATIGWDPVTGLGTPDFQKLKHLVLSL
ncbi:Tripeptidyl-peptidase [Metarhizium anisopliae BRIP 53293]|uniref:tripeptidyl-peptidase II n=1 Tax=Metarhizium anisopliae BRIP 53293 TaxID=1291518 RepID=A0A0D9NL67_METAN|nr:Tripeptidyl-peptidase [Metarhizium anisopliae BRIP 53293]